MSDLMPNLHTAIGDVHMSDQLHSAISQHGPAAFLSALRYVNGRDHASRLIDLERLVENAPHRGADMVPAVELGVITILNTLEHPDVNPLLPESSYSRLMVAAKVGMIACGDKSMTAYYSPYYWQAGYLELIPGADTDSKAASLQQLIHHNLEQYTLTAFGDVYRSGGGARLLAEQQGYSPFKALAMLAKSRRYHDVFGRVKRSHVIDFWTLLGAADVQPVDPSTLILEDGTVNLRPDIMQTAIKNRWLARGCPARSLDVESGGKTMLSTYYRRIAGVLLAPGTTVP